MSSSTDEDNDIDLRGSNVSYYKMLLENNYISDLSNKVWLICAADLGLANVLNCYISWLLSTISDL